MVQQLPLMQRLIKFWRSKRVLRHRRLATHYQMEAHQELTPSRAAGLLGIAAYHSSCAAELEDE